jgi:hypothetical protein
MATELLYSCRRHSLKRVFQGTPFPKYGIYGEHGAPGIWLSKNNLSSEVVIFLSSVQLIEFVDKVSTGNNAIFQRT